MRQQRLVVMLAFVTLLAAFIGFASLASGGSRFSGTLTAGERNTFAVATVVGIVAGLALLLGRRGSERERNPLGDACAAFIAALAFSLPAAWAFAHPVSTPTDDSSGCGTVSSPLKVFDAGTRESHPTPTCADRLRQQQVVAAGLATPSVLVTAVALAGGLRREQGASGYRG